LIGTYETSWTLLLQYRGASDLEVGLSWTLFALPFALLSVPAGRLAERADRRLLTVVSIAVSAAFAIVYAVLVSPALLVGLAALEAIGTVAATPAAVTVLSEAVPADAQGEAQGTAETARTAAAALAALVSGALFGIGPAVPFVACALVLVVGCGVITLSWRNGWSHPSTRLAARPQAERSLR
jgi:MFS family permease